MKISDIIINDTFSNTIPSESKMSKVKRYVEENGKQDKPIVVNKNNVLLDGYVRYLVLKNLGYEDALVKKLGIKKEKSENKNESYKNKLTTYIYGVHYNKKLDKYSKEYVWRIPHNRLEFEDDLLPGDVIMVNTKYGISPITITKIEWLRECPVEFPVKKVVFKKINSKVATN